jgi:hypothetical protein
MNTKCHHCRGELRNDGVQRDPLTRTAWLLGTCTNSVCPSYLSTFLCEPRPMTKEEMSKYTQFLSRMSFR